MTAEAESRIAAQSSRRPATAPPLTDDLSQLVSPLSVAIENEKTFPEDAFQARVCLCWIYWTIRKPDLVVLELAVILGTAICQFGQEGKDTAGATHVALLRGIYLRG